MKGSTLGSPFNFMPTLGTLSFFAVLVLVSMSLDVLASTSNTPTLQPTGEVINTKYLQITNHSFTEDLLFTIVNGTVVNNSNNTINSAEVSIQFYDDNSSLITSSTENARFVILAPGENSSFSVRSDLGDEIVATYKVIPGGDIQVG